MKTIESKRGISALLLLTYFAISMTCYFILAGAFQFPDILRTSPEYRFNLFLENQRQIVPTYYFWALTGIIQIFMSLALYSVHGSTGLLKRSALAAGMLCGAFQLVGFIRWVTLIPVLADAYQTGLFDAETLFFMEKMANGYLGMGLGEHMGNLLLGLWITLVSIHGWKERKFAGEVSLLGIISGSLFTILSFESLGVTFFEHFMIAGWGAIYVWIFLMAVILIRKKETNKPLHWGFWVGGFLFWLGNIIPGML